MKRFSPAALFTLLVFVLIASSSCKKILDEIVKHPSRGVVSDCRIEKIIARWGSGTSYDTAYFTYNKAGNPVRVKHSLHIFFPDEFRHRDLAYIYDSQNRLKIYLRGYQRVTDSVVAREWYVFEYSGNMIIRHSYTDASAPYSGDDDYNSISEIPTSYYTQLSTVRFITDLLGRIVVITKPGVYETHLSYDASGNLVGDGYTYSKNYSYLQTNKVWMLLTQNYSVNEKTAPLVWWMDDDFPVAFNSRKLPTKFESFYPSVFDFFRAESLFNNIEMIYKCK